MNGRKVGQYLLSMVLFIAFLSLSVKGLDQLRLYVMRSYDYHMLYWLLSYMIYPCIIGILLGTEHLINQKQRAGVWRTNWTRLLCWGVPAVFFSALPILYYLPVPILRDITAFAYTKILVPTQEANGTMQFLGLIFGYIVATSFRKEDQVSHTNDKNLTY